MEDVATKVRQDSQRPTALLAYDDGIGQQLCRLLPEAGLQVPADISVAGAVGTKGGTVAGDLVLTCGIADFREMGSQAMEALRRQATGRRARKHDLERVGCTLQTGGTTARPRGR